MRSEALTKLAETVTIYAVQSRVDDAMKTDQLGCGVPGGAALIINTVRAWAAGVGKRSKKVEISNKAVMGIDIENAYGMEATMKYAPGWQRRPRRSGRRLSQHGYVWKECGPALPPKGRMSGSVNHARAVLHEPGDGHGRCNEFGAS